MFFKSYLLFLSSFSLLEILTYFVFLLFIFSALAQFIYWVFIFSKLAFYKIPKNSSNLLINKSGGKISTANNLSKNQQSISVIICARNEAKNLQKNLPRILNQNYRNYEVIVVDDNSTDNTHVVLSKYEKQYPNLRIIQAGEKPAGMVGKKFPLKVGIAAARFETLLLTDADCCPASLEWIDQMQLGITDISSIALGYGPYFDYPTLLNRFIRFETVYTAIQYFSFALAGQPYMGVGRNLAYKKNIFKKIGGFKKHEHIASGDDDLFVSEAAKDENVNIVLRSDSFVFSEPKRTWGAYYRQKTRHLSTARSYRFIHKLLLGMLSASHFFFYFCTFFLLILKFSIIFVGSVFVGRTLLILFFYAPILKRFQDKKLLPWIPLLDAMYVLYYIIFTPIIIIGKKIRWK